MVLWTASLLPPAAKRRVSRTVKQASKRSSCGTKPIASAALLRVAEEGCMVTEPERVFNAPVRLPIALSSVDFPEPLAPILPQE